MSGGAPQGTKLGNFLFCATVDDIDEDLSLDTNHELNLNPSTSIDIESAIPEHYSVARLNSSPDCTMDFIY